MATDRQTEWTKPTHKGALAVASGALKTTALTLYCASVEFHEIFAMHDSDSDGWIPVNEITSVVKDIGVSVTKDEIVQAASDNVNSNRLL